MNASLKKTGRFFVFLFPILVALFCFVFVDTDSKQLLFVIPLFYCIINIMFYSNFRKIKNNIAVMLIEAICFVRLVVLPFAYAFVSAEQLFQGRVSVSANFGKACWLMVYEYLAVQASIFHYFHARKRSVASSHIRLKSQVDISKSMIVILLSFTLLVSIAFPTYAIRFKNILQISNENFTYASISGSYNVGTIGRAISTLFSMSTNILRILFPAYLLNREYCKRTEPKRVVRIMVTCCVMQFFFLTSTFAEAIVSCMVTVLYFAELYPEQRRKTFIVLIITSLGIMLLYFAVRYSVKSQSMLYDADNGSILYIANILNAYFTGVDNVAAAFNIPSGYEWKTIQAGFLGAIPFNSTLFGNRGNKLQFYFNQINRSYGQIPPTIGEGLYYFGWLFSPIFSFFLVKLSLYYQERAKQSRISLKFASEMFCSIIFSLGIAMYSPSIVLSWFFSWGVPMLILTSFANPSQEECGYKEIVLHANID